MREINLIKDRPVIKVLFKDEVILYIRYNEYGEYSYCVIFSPNPDDQMRFDNYDDLWDVETRPHHFHIRGMRDVVKSKMNGDPAHDITNLIKKIIQSTVEDKHFFLKVAVGDINVINFEYLKNDNIVWHMEDSAMNSIGYSLSEKSDKVEATLWIDFDDLNKEELFLEVQKSALEGLKLYAEFLEEGGDSEAYDKRHALVSPL